MVIFVVLNQRENAVKLALAVATIQMVACVVYVLHVQFVVQSTMKICSLMYQASTFLVFAPYFNLCIQRSPHISTIKVIIVSCACNLLWQQLKVLMIATQVRQESCSFSLRVNQPNLCLNEKTNFRILMMMLRLDRKIRHHRNIH